MRKSFHDVPVIDLSLRKFEKPQGSGEEIIRKFAISVGLLQPGDSRDVIVDLLTLFLRASKEKKFLDINDVYKHVLNINKTGVSQSNIRRHLLRLKDLDFIEKTPEGYRLREWLSFEDLIKDLVKYKIEPTMQRIIEYATLIDKQ